VALNTLVMFEVFYLFNARYLLAPVMNRRGLFGSRSALIAIGLVVVLQLLMTYAPPMQHLFGTRPIGAASWVAIVAVASTVLFLVEIEKWAVRFYADRRAAYAVPARSR
jgi:magnesium-transporting ATPase (P-type)